MNSPRLTAHAGSWRLFGALCLLSTPMLSCGGSDARVEQAALHLGRGEFQRAEQALGDATGKEADRLRERLKAGQQLELALEESMLEASLLEPKQEIQSLRELLERADNPAFVERLETAISTATDRAAEWRGRSRDENRKELEERISRANQRAHLRASDVIVPDLVRESSSAETPVDSANIEQGAEEAEAVVAQLTPAEAQIEEPVEVVEEEVAEGLTAEGEPFEIVTIQLDDPPEESFDPDRPRASSSSDDEEQDVAAATIDEDLSEQLEIRERALLRASIGKRDEAWDELQALGEAARPHLARALLGRWTKAQSDLLSSASFKALERVAQDREELDLHRENAIALIFDKEKYFYPYRPPECPPEKARLYWGVQREVDELVGELREVWENPRRAKIAKDFFEDRAELNWCNEKASEWSFPLQSELSIPLWADFVVEGAKETDTQHFAWDEQEARQLENDSAVRARNAALWQKKYQQVTFEDAQMANSEEQRQVQITNDYRRMFGHQALAWNPMLQDSSDGHSAYMAKTGEFGHYEKGDESRRSPFDRMRLAGYTRGVSENCHLGGGSAQGAHDGWCKSSGHHRNLLTAGHTEMASAVDGRYWTQNFGTDTAFRSEIDSWQD